MFCKFEIINKNTILDLLRFSRRLLRRLTFVRGGRQSADIAFLVCQTIFYHQTFSSLIFVFLPTAPMTINYK